MGIFTIMVLPQPLRSPVRLYLHPRKRERCVYPDFVPLPGPPLFSVEPHGLITGTSRQPNGLADVTDEPRRRGHGHVPAWPGSGQDVLERGGESGGHGA